MTLRRSPSTRRRDAGRWFPIVGAVAILGLLAAVYVSYTANDGVPGTSYRSFTVEVPDGNRLVKNGQVRIAGVRVGQVLRIDAVPGQGGAPAFARLRVSLNPDAPRVPVDSVAKVRPASILGATYLDIVPGRARASVGDGGTLTLAHARSNVELTDLLDVFDPRTSKALQSGVTELGGGLAGRGQDLGRTVTDVNRLVPSIAAVARGLADPRTRLGGLIVALEAASGQLDGVQAELLRGLRDGGTTFDALDRSGEALGRTLEAFPGTARVATVALRRLRPALDGLGRIAVDLRPATAVLPDALRQTNAVFGAAVPWLRQVPGVTPDLRAAAAALRRFGEGRSTVKGLRRVGDVAVATDRLLDALTPAQVHCNYISLFGQGWHNVFGHLGQNDGPPVGSAILTQLGTNPIELLQNREPLPNLHTNYTPNANADECEAGNEPFSYTRRDLSNPAGLQSTKTKDTAANPLVVKRAEAAGLSATPPGDR